MNDNECNRVIAEFMGEWRAKFAPELKMDHANIPYEYTESLDALVPVWKKLSVNNMRIDFFSCTYDVYIRLEGTQGVGDSKTIQQAAAHATCKAIQELSK